MHMPNGLWPRCSLYACTAACARRHMHGCVHAQNIVGSVDVRFPIRLEGLALKHDRYSSVG